MESILGDNFGKLLEHFGYVYLIHIGFFQVFHDYITIKQHSVDLILVFFQVLQPN